MHELLFRHQQELSDLDLTHLALTARPGGLPVFVRPWNVPPTPAASATTSTAASAAAVRGTPTFFINGCRYPRPGGRAFSSGRTHGSRLRCDRLWPWCWGDRRHIIVVQASRLLPACLSAC